jgi:hypothetical protein
MYTLLNETPIVILSILSSLVGAVYAFGFISSCAQLYLNYKLKSVAHLPWRQIVQILNAIINSLSLSSKCQPCAALSVFRDDIVFAIYPVQRWIYRVDKRAPRFGYERRGGGRERRRG